MSEDWKIMLVFGLIAVGSIGFTYMFEYIQCYRVMKKAKCKKINRK